MTDKAPYMEVNSGNIRNLVNDGMTYYARGNRLTVKVNPKKVIGKRRRARNKIKMKVFYAKNGGSWKEIKHWTKDLEPDNVERTISFDDSKYFYYDGGKDAPKQPQRKISRPFGVLLFMFQMAINDITRDIKLESAQMLVVPWVCLNAGCTVLKP
jgi:hypothetical protein